VYIYLLIHVCYRSSHLIFLYVTQLRTLDESEKPHKTNESIDWLSQIILDSSFFMPVGRDNAVGIPSLYGLEVLSVKWELGFFPGARVWR
jgi:hypothetical protein